MCISSCNCVDALGVTALSHERLIVRLIGRHDDAKLFGRIVLLFSLIDLSNCLGDTVSANQSDN